MESDDFEVQVESAWIITNLASGTSSDVNFLIGLGVIERMIPLLSSTHEAVWSQVVWAYGNLAGDSIQVRNLVINKEEIVSQLVRLAMTATQTADKSDTIGGLRNLAWTISNCCRGKPTLDPKLITMFSKTLMALFSCGDSDVASSVCWSFAYLTDGSNNHIKAATDTGFVGPLVKLGEDISIIPKDVALPLVRALGNITTGDEAETQLVIDSGGIEMLFKFACSPSFPSTVRKEACWALSNICGGTIDQIRNVVEHPNLLSHFMSTFHSEPQDVQKEIIWMIANISEREKLSFTLKLYELEYVKLLLSVLHFPEVRMNFICLLAIYHIGKCLHQEGMIDEFEDFKDCIEINGGLDRIEELQHSRSEQVYQKAVQILETFFGAVEEGADEKQEVLNEG